MTQDNREKKAASLNRRLDIIKRQIDDHMENSHPAVSTNAVDPLLTRAGELIDELVELTKWKRPSK